MAGEHFIVIGHGPAGNQAALTLREQIPDARVTLIGKEVVRCYKHHLLPDFISGKIGEDMLYSAPLDLYKSKEIKLRLGQKVEDVNFSKREITLDHKEVIHFDGLIIAVGGRPRIPEPLHTLESLMMPLKTLADAKSWVTKLKNVESVLIIGGDLTSFAMAKSLIHLGKEVKFLLHEDAFWPVRFNREVYDQAAHQLSQKGAEMVPGKKITGISHLSDGRLQVQVDDRKFQTGVVGAFFGLVPDVRFLAHSGFQIERGILVDEYLFSGFEGVYAAGDCAQVYHPELHDYWVSIGYENAVNLGRIAAMNLAGGRIKADLKSESIFRVDGVRANISWWMGF